MRILIKSGTTEQFLCHGHVEGKDKHVGPTDMRTEGPVALQIVERLRATAAKAISRGNVPIRLAFSVTRECQTAQAAEKFCLTHPRDVLRSDTVIVQAETVGGASDKITISDAVLAGVVCQQVGLTVLIQYDIAGGSIA